MCYNFNNKGVNLKKAIQDFNAEQSDAELILNGSVSAFTKTSKPDIPTIVNYNGIILKNLFWGTKENPDAPTKGKNLRSENTHTYYKKIEANRCLIPASSYIEYKSISVPGKKTTVKVKHQMFWEKLDQFYIAGFYDIYANGELGFGLVTTIPNPVQAEIHNRMIITMDSKKGNDFLQGLPIEEFQFPNYSPNLSFKNLEPEKIPNTLF